MLQPVRFGFLKCGSLGFCSDWVGIEERLGHARRRAALWESSFVGSWPQWSFFGQKAGTVQTSDRYLSTTRTLPKYSLILSLYRSIAEYGRLGQELLLIRPEAFSGSSSSHSPFCGNRSPDCFY